MRSNAASIVLFLSGLAVALAASTTRAQDAEASDDGASSVVESRGPRTAQDDRRFGHPDHGGGETFAAWGSAAIFSGRLIGADVTAVTGDVGMRLGMLDGDGRMSLDWGFVYAITRVRGSFGMAGSEERYDRELERVEAGNPVLAFDWSHLFGPVRFGLGLGVAIPVAARSNVPGNVDAAAERQASEVAHATYAAMHGAWNPWRTFAERAAWIVPLHLALEADMVAILIEVAGAVTVPVLGGTRGIEGVMQAAVDASFAVAPWARVGARAQIVVFQIGASGSAGTEAQPSVEAYGRFEFEPAFFTVRGVMDFAGPYGFGGAASGGWAIHLGGGAAVD